MKIGLLTGGGDAPGLNGIIESTSRALLGAGVQVIGIKNGFEGIFEHQTLEISYERVKGLHAEAGTLLGTSNKSAITGRELEFIAAYKKIGLDGIIVAGGDGTFRGLESVKSEISIIGVPKTIDNDLPGTDFTFGFDTACAAVAESVDALSHTARAHRRIFVVETMGRTSGWIALGGGLSSYADIILIPERPYGESDLLDWILEKKKTHESLMIVVSEGVMPKGGSPTVSFTVPDSPQAERYGGVSEKIARWIERETNWESRHIVLGHLQRSRAPTTTDRFLTLGMGVRAAQLALDRKWGRAVVFTDGRVNDVEISAVMGEPRLVSQDHRWVNVAKSIGIYI